MTEFSEWVDSAALAKDGIENDSDMARLFKVKPSTVARWRTAAGPPDQETLRNIAAGLRLPMILVLEKAGFLTAEEANVTEVEVPRRLTNQELVDEVKRRLVDDESQDRPRSARGTTSPKRTAGRAKGLQHERKVR